MHVIDYTIGETKIWRARPRVTGGGIADLTGASAELRITAAADHCLALPASVDGDAFAVTLDPDSLDMVSGRYAAALWIHWPDGQHRSYGQFVLIIKPGC